MISFLWKKIWKNKWIFLCLLMGNILLAGVVAGVPIYSRASMQRMLIQQAKSVLQSTDAYPGLISFATRIGANGDLDAKSYFHQLRETFAEDMPERFGVPLLSKREAITLEGVLVEPDVKLTATNNRLTTTITGMTDFEEHAVITNGTMYGDAIGEDGVLSVVCSSKTYDQQKIMMNTTYISSRYQLNGQPLAFRVVGIFESKLESDPYWSTAPALITNGFFIPHDLAYDLFIEGYEKGFAVNAEWNNTVDCTALDVTQINSYLRTLNEYYDTYMVSSHKFSESLTRMLLGFAEKELKLTSTLWVLQTPVFVMLVFFIYMISGRILSLDRNDISVLKSRGATRLKIVWLYVLQGILVAVVSGFAGLGLGLLICQVTGASNGFLDFVNRASLNPQLDMTAVLYVCIAMAASMLMMLIPVIGYSKVNILDLKRETGRPKRQLWKLFFLDIIALGLSLYIWRLYSGSGFAVTQSGGQQTVDPMLFLASSLFITGAALLGLRLFPLVLSLLFKLVRRYASPALYASLLSVRRGGGEQFIMLFLMFTLATGIFNSRTAMTINKNLEDRVSYTYATDIRLQERWGSNASIGEDGKHTAATMYYEPDFTKYTLIPEITGLTKVVMQKNATISGGGHAVNGVQLMGIQTDEFGKLVWFRDDLLPVHINNYLNAMARDPRGVLLSSNLKGSIQVGDLVTFSAGATGTGTGVVCGFVDYFPGFEPVTVTPVPDTPGEYATTVNSLIVVNQSYLLANWGVTPYEIWIDTDAASGNFMTAFANDRRISYAIYQDAKDALAQQKNDPVVQGTNGVLTVNFIITLLICGAGFLIYWILSIKGRALQFGVFRAMGMPMRGIFSILVTEQVLVSGVAIGLGVGIGEIASRFFVPMIQAAYSAADNVIPLLVAADVSDYGRLLVFVGLMIVVCLSILGFISSKIRIAAALKLGED